MNEECASCGRSIVTDDAGHDEDGEWQCRVCAAEAELVARLRDACDDYLLSGQAFGEDWRKA